MNRVTLSVPEISCDHCKTSIEGAVGALRGVTEVDVTIDAKTVDVTFEDSVALEEITAAIEDQGYDVGS